MKKIKHIYNYLTKPTYRFWVDFCSLKENVDRNMKEIEDNLRLSCHPMFYVENNNKNISKLKRYEKPSLIQ